MGDEGQNHSNHRAIVNNMDDEEQTSPLPVKSKQFFPANNDSTKPKKSSWQIARDATVNILARQSSRLSVKLGSTPSFTRQRSIHKRNSFYEVATNLHPQQGPRVPRMPSKTEADRIAISYELLCSCCNGPCIGDYLRCRICTKACHLECLYERGYIADRSSNLPRLSKQNWSCPDCSDLTRLLDQDELDTLIHAFDQIDQNKDGYIVIEEFLSFQPTLASANGLELFVQHNHEVGTKYFSLMDSAQQGVVAWSDFALFYSCKTISAKNKASLAMKLSDKELVLAKVLFFKDQRKTFDNDLNILITGEHYKQVHHDLLLSLEKKYGIDFIEAILGFEDSMTNKLELQATMNWEEFLRKISVVMLLNRVNDDIRRNQPRRAEVPKHLVKIPPVRSEVASSDISSVAASNSLIFQSTETPMLPDISFDKSFRKHALLLKKLNEINRRETLLRKQMGSCLNFTILESVEEKNINLPKLKRNARDDRKSVTDPWTAAKELQRLRNTPISVKRIPNTTMKTGI